MFCAPLSQISGSSSCYIRFITSLFFSLQLVESGDLCSLYNTITTIALCVITNYNFQTNNPLEKMDIKVHYSTPYLTNLFKYFYRVTQYLQFSFHIQTYNDKTWISIVTKNIQTRHAFKLLDFNESYCKPNPPILVFNDWI